MENHPNPNHSASASPEHVPQRSEQFRSIPQPSEAFGTMPNNSEAFRTVPHNSETFRKVPNRSEDFRSERKQSHTITVRDTAKMFEEAGVARTERSIVNWCQRDANGFARLDAYFDPNERRYFITEESIQRTISEEKAKAFRNGQNNSEAVPKRSESFAETKQTSGNTESDGSADSNLIKKQLLDLQILNAGKDMVIKQLREERDGWIHQMIEGSRKIGELETRLLQLEEPTERKLQVRAARPNNCEILI